MKLTAIKPSSNERCIDCANYVEGDICHICEFIPEQKTTNADKIRSMSDEELAEWIETIADCRLCKIDEEHCSGGELNTRASCMIHWLDWIRKEVTE